MRKIYACLFVSIVLACGSEDAVTPAPDTNDTTTDQEITTCFRENAVPAASPKIDLVFETDGNVSSCYVLNNGTKAILAVGEGVSFSCLVTYDMDGSSSAYWEFDVGLNVSAEYTSISGEFNGTSTLLTCD